MDIELEKLNELQKEEIQKIKEKYSSLKKEVKKKYKLIEKQNKEKTKRKTIPKSVKDKLWDDTYGPSKGEAECYVCNCIINSKKFDCGHIVSVKNGGSDSIDNLKPICSTCNKSMGIENLEDFKSKYFKNNIQTNSQRLNQQQNFPEELLSKIKNQTTTQGFNMLHPERFLNPSRFCKKCQKEKNNNRSFNSNKFTFSNYCKCPIDYNDLFS